ncbi:MAG: M36 family metallopeptidase [Polyangiaceae bacterium]
MVLSNKVVRASRFSVALLLLGVAGGCSTKSDAEDRSTGSGLTAKDVANLPYAITVAHTDETLGVPSFAWVKKTEAGVPRAFDGMNAEARARAVVAKFSKELGQSEIVETLAKPSTHDTGSGAVIVRFNQRVSGKDVFMLSLAVAMDRDLEPVAITGFLAPRLASVGGDFAPDAKTAIANAYQKFTTARLDKGSIDFVRELEGGYVRYEIAPAGEAKSNVRTKALWFATKAGLVPAHYVEITHANVDTNEADMRSFVVSDVDGSILFEKSLSAADAYTYRVWADPTTKIPYDGPMGNDSTPYPTAQASGYVPTMIAPQLVSIENFPFKKNDPWLPRGATVTTGNNVDAYADLAKPDGFSANTADVRGAIGTGGAFDALYDTRKSPTSTADNVQGSIQHLFYLTNFLHDWYYDVGFDEASGNHQKDNFGRGGLGNDPLRAEAQDFSGRNNANMQTPPDGESPVMQMYIFSGPSVARLTITSPASAAGVKDVGVAPFGPQAFETSGQVVLAVDGQGGDPNDACEAISNASAIAGKIALIHRGSCEFQAKTKAAQAAGAAGVIIVNVPSSNSPNTAPAIGGQATGVTVPVVSLSQPDGAALEALVAGGVNVTLYREESIDLDGSLDSAIVSHEWGHFISNRLIGDGEGINIQQAVGMGEGWGDFSSLMLLARKDDLRVAANENWAGAYPSGAYAMSGAGDDFYFGIRRYPYSVDMTKNPLTFKHIQDGVKLPANVRSAFGQGGESNSEVHNTGEVWASMLWECYVSLLRDPRYSFEQAQAKMKQYLVSSLKLTPISPDFLDARDAVLAAALATDKADFELFANAFARRGAGVGAKAPPKGDRTNQGVVESFVVGNDVTLLGASITDDGNSCDKDGILDDGESGTVTIEVKNSGTGTLTGTTAKFSSASKGVVFENGGLVKLGTAAPFEKLTAKIGVSLKGAEPSELVDIDIAIDDPDLSVKRTIKGKLSVRTNTDEVAASSATDTVDPSNTTWTAKGKDGSGMTLPWERTADGVGKVWHVVDNDEPSDHTLTSTDLAVDGTKLEIAFRHRYSFEADKDANYDGGMIEVSFDSGKTWTDVGTAVAGYGGKLSADGDNPLKGRDAFVGKSAGYPAWVNAKIAIDVPASARAGAVQVRFRVGTDNAVGDLGWDIDDIAFTGITGTPFASLVDETELCNADGTGTKLPEKPGTGKDENVTQTPRLEPTPVETPSKGGCSTHGSAPVGSFAFGLGALAALAVVRRNRKKSA